MILREAETGRAIAEQAEIADTFWKRGIGLIGRKSLAEGAALWLEPCNGIHTFGMRFAIDVLYLDKNGVALRLLPNTRPNRICLPLRGVRVTVEFPAGTLAARNVCGGARYELVPPSPPVKSP